MREMRRKDKQITDREEILSIIRKSTVCRLAMTDGERPYIVPMCFGLDGDRLYFHCATEGTKLDLLRKNPNVCVEFDIDVEVVPSEKACSIGIKYRSVIGFGRAGIVSGEEDIRHGMDAIIRQYGGDPSTMDEAILRETAIIRVDIGSLTGKKSGYPKG